MVCNYSNTVAMKHGINSALIAGYISNEIFKTGVVIDNRPWVRVTQKCLTAVFPFMGEKAVRSAVRRLRKANIVTVKQFKKSEFDHGNFYTFTDYGYRVLRGNDVDERKSRKATAKE